MKDKKSFGSFIKEKRIEKNYSQKDLAEILFVTESAVSKWERGVTYPDITLITSICRALDITEHELIESSHDEEYRNIKKDAAKFNNIKKSIFWTLNIGYTVALLVCFIVNLAVDHTLSWFFIVLTAIMCAYSICPTITWIFSKYKKVVFIGSTFITLFLLLLTCSIFTNDYWFMIPTLGTLLGYFIIFYPILFKSQKNYLDEEKYKKLSRIFLLSYSVGMLALTILLLVTIYCYTSFNLALGIIITCGCSLVLIIFGVVMLFDISKNIVKPLILGIVGLLILLIIVGCACSLYLLSTYKLETHNFKDTYSSIEIDVTTYDINIHLSDDNENRISFGKNDKFTAKFHVINDILTIEENDYRMFYESAFTFKNYSIDLYLSKTSIDSLIIDGTTCDIDINHGFDFNDVEIHNVTGNIKFNSNVKNDLSLKTTTGHISVKDSNNNGNIKIKSGTGDIKIQNVNGKYLEANISTGDLNLRNVIILEDAKLTGGTSDIYFDDFDAKNIYIKTSTGDVIGTLLTPKIIIPNTGTGDIELPDSYEGYVVGECNVNTGTGDIEIKFKQ